MATPINEFCIGRLNETCYIHLKFRFAINWICIINENDSEK